MLDTAGSRQLQNGPTTAQSRAMSDNGCAAVRADLRKGNNFYTATSGRGE